MFRLAAPSFLWLVLLPAFIVWWNWRRSKRLPAWPISSLSLLEVPVAPSWRWRLRWLPSALRDAWLGLLVLALARPQTPDLASAIPEPGLSLTFVIDVSGSMATPESIDEVGKPQTRLDQARAALRAIIFDKQQKLLRPRDKVGVVALARYARVVCPSTTYHQALWNMVENLQVEIRDNRTNLGDALALAVTAQSETPGVIILCTDGAHNVEDALFPEEVAPAAAALGIRIHSIGVGSAKTTGDRAGFELDEVRLREIARLTGGQFFRATDLTAARAVGERLGEMEPPSIAVVGYRAWRELFPEVLLLALVSWFLEILLSTTWLRVTPELPNPLFPSQ